VNWEAVAAVGQVIGAGGIIATLIYLARQIGQNTKAMRISVAHSIAMDARDWNKPLLADASLALVFQTGTEDPSSLDEKDRARFIELCFSLLHMFENAHYQFQNGTLDQELWDGYRRLYIAYAKSPGFQAYWKARRQTFRPDFQTFIDEHGPPEVGTWGALLEGSPFGLPPVARRNADPT
jgi:hypothetical protein